MQYFLQCCGLDNYAHTSNRNKWHKNELEPLHASSGNRKQNHNSWNLLSGTEHIATPLVLNLYWNAEDPKQTSAPKNPESLEPCHSQTVAEPNRSRANMSYTLTFEVVSCKLEVEPGHSLGNLEPLHILSSRPHCFKTLFSSVRCCLEAAFPAKLSWKEAPKRWASGDIRAKIVHIHPLPFGSVFLEDLLVTIRLHCTTFGWFDYLSPH